ncbi:MAG TPA: hypothetical protein VIV65_05565 [Gemmatimonadaceae bacterium]
MAIALVGVVRIAHGQSNCPDATDTPEILTTYVGVAFRSLKTDPGRPLPEPCLLVTVAQKAHEFRELTINQALTLDSILLVSKPADPALLDAKFLLAYQVRRLDLAKSAFDQLAAVDSARLDRTHFGVAVAAAELSADTASALRYLLAAATRFPDKPNFKVEYDLLRQVPRLRALIDTVRKVVRSDPTKTGGYASLASIYGQLGETDSALAWIARGRRAKTPPADLAGAVASIVNSVTRRAELQRSIEQWEAALSIAFDLDSAYTMDATKYFVAVTIASTVAGRLELQNFFRPTLVTTHGHGSFDSIDITRPPRAPTEDACQSLAVMGKLIAYGQDRMTAGGVRYAQGDIATVTRNLTAISARIRELAKACG